MPVDSYLELFTTLFGWQFYDVLWGVLRDTGIVFLPFLGILIDNFVEPYRGGNYGSRVSLSLQRMEIDIFLAFFVVVLAGQPFVLTPLDANILTYDPPPTLEEANPPQATVANSQSTYGATGFVGTPNTVNLPLWWFGVISLSAGIDHAVVAGLPTPADLRAITQQAKLATIKKPTLRKEVGEFYSQCFVPARSKYTKDKPDTPAIQAILDEFGNDDPDWMGSHVYRETPGYYDTLHSNKQIAGWPYDPARDVEYDPQDNPPQWGHPTCAQWWESGSFGIPEGTNSGLRQKLIGEAGRFQDLLATAGSVVSSVFGLQLPSQESIDDSVAKTVLSKEPVVYSSNEFRRNSGDPKQGFFGSMLDYAFGGKAASDAGIGFFSWLFRITMNVIVPALPMIQAMVLLGIYALLPMLVILSRYSLGMLFTGAMLIFTVKFWTVLWYLAEWVDDNLMASMYANTNILIAILSGFAVGAGQEHLSKRLVLDMISVSMYLGLPLLWTGIMGLAGIRVGRVADNIGGSLRSPAQRSGDQGGSFAKSGVSSVTGGRLRP